MKSLHDARGELRAAKKHCRQFPNSSTMRFFLKEKQRKLSELLMNQLSKKAYSRFRSDTFIADKEGKVVGFVNLIKDKSMILVRGKTNENG